MAQADKVSVFPTKDRRSKTHNNANVRLQGFNPLDGTFGEVREEPSLKPRELIEFHPDAGYSREESLDHNVLLSLRRSLPVARYIQRGDTELMEKDVSERLAAAENSLVSYPNIRCRIEHLYWPVEVGKVKIVTRVGFPRMSLSFKREFNLLLIFQGKMTSRLDPATKATPWGQPEQAQSVELIRFLNTLVNVPSLANEVFKSITGCTAFSQTCQKAFNFMETHMVWFIPWRWRIALANFEQGRWDYSVAGFTPHPGPVLFFTRPRIYMDDLAKSLTSQELALNPEKPKNTKAGEPVDFNKTATDENVEVQAGRQLSADFKKLGLRSLEWAHLDKKTEWAKDFTKNAKLGCYKDLGRAPLGIVQSLPSVSFGRLRLLFKSINAYGSGIKIFHLDRIPFIDIRAFSIMVGGLPKLEAVTIVNCQQIHIGCVPTLLDVVHKHTRDMEKRNQGRFHLDVFPHFEEGPRSVLRRATYGASYNKIEKQSVLGGVLVILLKTFLKSLMMKLNTPLLARDSLLFKWMQKIPADDDFWAMFITYLRAYETFFGRGSKKSKKLREKIKNQNSTLCDDILAMIYNPDGRRTESFQNRGAHFWLRQRSACEWCEYHLPNVCFPGMPRAGGSTVCIGCRLHLELDEQVDHLKMGIVETLDLLYGTNDVPDEEESLLAATDLAALVKRRELGFPGERVPLGENCIITELSSSEKNNLRGAYRTYPLKDNTSDLPTLDEILSPEWQERWSQAASGGRPRPHGNRMFKLLKGEQRFSLEDYPKRLWAPSFDVKGAKNLDFAFLQMQTIGKGLWPSNKSDLEHEQHGGPLNILDDGKSTLNNQHSYRQTAVKLLLKLHASYLEKRHNLLGKSSRDVTEILYSMFSLAPNDDRGFEFEHQTGFSKTHRQIAQLAQWHRENGIAIDGLEITSQFLTEDPEADLSYASTLNQYTDTSSASYQSSVESTPSPGCTPPQTITPLSSCSSLGVRTPSRSPPNKVLSTYASITAQDTPTRMPRFETGPRLQPKSLRYTTSKGQVVLTPRWDASYPSVSCWEDAGHTPSRYYLAKNF